MNQTQKFDRLYQYVEKIYQKHKKRLLFHGWHHIKFILNKSVEFTSEIKADLEIIKAAALTHDLNFVVERDSESEPEVAGKFRQRLLSQAGYSPEEITQIEGVIIESHMEYRSEKISPEGKALADADALFKILPTTLILFANKYISQNKVSVQRWADKIVAEQIPLMDKGIYFYTDTAKSKYLDWAKLNLKVCSLVKDSLKDPDVREMLNIAKEAGIL